MPLPTAPKPPASHPTYSVMIAAAITALKERNGSSRQAILKYIKANYKVGDNADVVVRNQLPKLAKAGKLVQTKGKGASGSFKVVKAAAAPKPKKAPAAKAKKTAVKKKSPAKKGVAKKKKSVGEKKKAAAPKAKKASSAAKKASPKKKSSSVKKPAAKKASLKKKTPKKPTTKKSAPKKK